MRDSPDEREAFRTSMGTSYEPSRISAVFVLELDCLLCVAGFFPSFLSLSRPFHKPASKCGSMQEGSGFTGSGLLSQRDPVATFLFRERLTWAPRVFLQLHLGA
jgi:hypothetical protein